MPIRCSVPNCVVFVNKNFRIPVVDVRSSGQYQKLLELRRLKWVQNCQLPADPAPHHRVCSRHFVSGKPANPNSIDNVDWVPTINLPPMLREYSLLANGTIVIKNEQLLTAEVGIEENDNKQDVIQHCTTVYGVPSASLNYSGSFEPKRRSSSGRTMLPCRVCGQNIPDEPALADSFTNHARVYMELISVELHDHEVPEQLRICQDCKNKLYDFKKFRENCVQVHWGLVKVKAEPVCVKQESDKDSFLYDALATSSVDSISTAQPSDDLAEENNDDQNDKSSEHMSASSNEYYSYSSSEEEPTILPTRATEMQTTMQNESIIYKRKKIFPSKLDCLCPRRCADKFKEQDMEQLFERFWKSKEEDYQKPIIIEYVQCVEADSHRKRTVQGTRPNRADVCLYHFPSEGKLERVCHKYFFGILQISTGKVNKYLGRKSQ
ncbi:uncharacterized protein LOC134220609 isoform X2 [Armigeres subalbatus]|uniref:uncharacterized protein LOC134220609 isoform X2 n=1 Tax=Armigeres subalbatus TaxID=124917 RepID=UPI002ED29581